ncbi:MULTISPECIES: Yip1 family protein [Bacillus]|uniref:Yip1 family protein n=1 Tax=Bacillus TaxID=1386 RepID=UPI0004138B32|nr:MULTISPECIES: Yip1 family protein [Bacillus]QHZ46626.1 YIP1 family protein [Bacillus sp. NSP9.1]WFA06759.1 Yip1 family protein [Bacillus sp. HSf4]
MEANVETVQKQKKPSLLGIIISPVRQFERMRERPAIWLALIISLALSAFSVYLSYWKLNEELLFEFNPGMLAARDIFRSIIFYVLSGLVLWLIAKIGGGKTNFACMVSLSVFGTFVVVIRDVIISLIYYFTNSDIAFSFSSLDGYIPAEEPLSSVLALFDIFTIWAFVLVAIGLQKAAGASKRAAWIGVSVLFVVFLLFSYLLGLFFLFLQNLPN